MGKHSLKVLQTQVQVASFHPVGEEGHAGWDLIKMFIFLLSEYTTLHWVKKKKIKLGSFYRAFENAVGASFSIFLLLKPCLPFISVYTGHRVEGGK